MRRIYSKQSRRMEGKDGAMKDNVKNRKMCLVTALVFLVIFFAGVLWYTRPVPFLSRFPVVSGGEIGISGCFLGPNAAG